jgi:hypothetical protein
MPKHMDISLVAVTPPSVNAGPGEFVELRPSEDCKVVFNLGFGLNLKKNQIYPVMMTNDGDHEFVVLGYDHAPVVMQESVSIRGAAGGGTTVMTETAVIASPMVPTGNIVVP